MLRNIWQNAQKWLVARGRTIKAEALSKCIRRYPQRRRAAAPQRASGAQNRATRRVLKLTRQTEDLVRLMRNIGLGCAPWQAVHLWTKIRMAGRAVLKSSNWFRYWQRHTLPPLSALQRLAQDLRAEAASRHEQERAERMESWKRWLKADFKACCDFCKGDCTERVTMVQREDGTHTANAARCISFFKMPGSQSSACMIRWCRLLGQNPRSALENSSHLAHPAPGASAAKISSPPYSIAAARSRALMEFRSRPGGPLGWNSVQCSTNPRTECPVERMTGDKIMNSCNMKKNTSPGADGWRVIVARRECATEVILPW